MSDEKHGFFEKIEEKIEEHKEERKAEHERVKHDPNKKQREIDRDERKTTEYDDAVAFAGEEIANEET